MVMVEMVHMRRAVSVKHRRVPNMGPGNSCTMHVHAHHVSAVTGDLDGPYAETKEALLGFYVIDCDNLDHALSIARELAAANPGGAYEVRPVRLFLPGEPGVGAT